jgi:hypothetical protein
MPAFKNITGLRFGRLIAVEWRGRDARGQSLWLCRCDCGSEKIQRGGDLNYGRQSCGCIRREKLIAQTTVHGQSKTPTWQSWKGMLERCYNPRSASYKWYGGRGVGIDDPRWFSFPAFAEDMGEKPPGTSLDRRNNDLGYCKANCRWATPKQQTDNRRQRPIKDKFSALQPDRQVAR